MKKRERLYFFGIKSRKMFRKKFMEAFIDSWATVGLVGTNAFINDKGQVEVKMLTPDECLDFKAKWVLFLLLKILLHPIGFFQLVHWGHIHLMSRGNFQSNVSS